jgi:hypothetical protein
LQKNVEIGHTSNLEQLKQPKINLKAMTFDSGDQNELQDITKNIKPKLYNLSKIILQNCDTSIPNRKFHEN